MLIWIMHLIKVKKKWNWSSLVIVSQVLYIMLIDLNLKMVVYIKGKWWRRWLITKLFIIVRDMVLTSTKLVILYQLNGMLMRLLMVKQLYGSKMEICILVQSLNKSYTGMVFTFIKQALIMKVFGIMIKDPAIVLKFYMMVINLRVDINTESNRDMESINGLN